VVILSLILSVIAIVIGGIALLSTSMIISKLIEKNYFPTPTENTKSDTSPQAEYERGLMEGRDSTWYAIQLSLFNMFKNADIFDFEGSVENLQTNLSQVITDPKLRDTLMDELTEYIKGSNNGNDDT